MTGPVNSAGGAPRLPLTALWKLITTPRQRVPRDAHARELEDQAVARRFMTPSDIEDLLNAYGLGWHDYEVPLEQLGRYFDLIPIVWYQRPSAPGKDTYGSDALRLEDAVNLLIQIERLGFAIRPERIVAAVASSVAKAEKLTAAELDAHGYVSRRGKWPPLSLRTDREPTAAARREPHRTTTGYNAEAWIEPDGTVVQVVVRAPGYRRPRPAVEIECPACGMSYMRGDTDSSAAHRSEHKRRMRALDPAPHQQLLAARSVEAEPTLVRAQSAAWKHREMYERARAFKREFHYDFMQWGSERKDDDPDVHGFLLDLPDGRIAGACAFRLRTFSDGRAPRWGLQWVWIAPQFRRSGVLARRWLGLRERFGEFRVEGPVSPAMQAFLAKRGESRLIE